MDEFNDHNDPYRIQRPEEPGTSGLVCFCCGYDLTGTEQGGICPECGIPVAYSTGHGPLATLESDALRTIAGGFRNAMAGILLYVIITFASMIASIMIGVLTIQQIQPGQAPTFSRGYFLVNFGSSLLTTLTMLIYLVGWWRITTPLDGLPEVLRRNDWRRILRITIPIQAAAAVLGLAWNAFSFAVMQSASSPGYQPTLHGWGLMLVIISILAALVLLANLVVFWIFQMLYARWFARLALNKPMAKRAKHLIWSGPLMVVFGAMCLMIGPLVFAILYYLMHRNLRRDVQAILDERPMAAPQTI